MSLWEYKTFRVVKENPQLEIGTIFTSEVSPIPNAWVWIEDLLVGGYKHDAINCRQIRLDEVEEITDGHQDIQGN